MEKEIHISKAIAAYHLLEKVKELMGNDGAENENVLERFLVLLENTAASDAKASAEWKASGAVENAAYWGGASNRCLSLKDTLQRNVRNPGTKIQLTAPQMSGFDFEPNKPSGTEAEVCKDIAERQQKGIAKYGVTVSGNPLSLREWLKHAYEETLDNAIYLKRAIEDINRKEIS